MTVEACAEDTKGQTCYICTQALHWKTKEGLVRGCACRGTAGFVHVSCLAEQAKILCDEAEENNLDIKAKNERFRRWQECSLCEQTYHGGVKCALGWACWKTYLGRPETDEILLFAMGVLGSALSAAKQYEDALSVREASLATRRRIGAPEESMLVALGSLANSYHQLGRLEETNRILGDVYSRHCRLSGEDGESSLASAYNYANSFSELGRFEEARSLSRKAIPVTRRVLGKNHELTLRMKWIYACALYKKRGATLDERREAVTTLEETARTAQRVLGGAHPTAAGIEKALRNARDVLRAQEILQPRTFSRG
ncbi:unnamed protein product [Pelagomonas calceolata]|uniref:RING-CH-type domain-containing protein n=2 Tax=Pelagomonas calceolata TaxID=35677 RepID=A0A8J2SFU9_9STRA|nr:unnamed protein product [Pelagomonas calceolata]